MNSSHHRQTTRFPHLSLFFSCRKTDCLHHKTTASSYLLPLLNWQRGTATLALGLISTLDTNSSVAASLLLSPLSLLHSSIAADEWMTPHGKKNKNKKGRRGSTLPVDNRLWHYDQSVLWEPLYHYVSAWTTLQPNKKTLKTKTVGWDWNFGIPWRG